MYSETDAKNQPLQQNLSTDQVQTLANAGDNQNLMSAPSAYLDTYSENKILYKKTIVNGISVFVYSNVSTDELYNVKFSIVGNNLGNYVLSSSSAIGKIYRYVAPLNGIPQGNYEPIVKLIAPTDFRVKGVSRRHQISVTEAKKITDDMDKKRSQLRIEFSGKCSKELRITKAA